ncbi:cardiolipin synthase [Desulfobotulus alkaliphilus]|uniref:Cardiolipin synthase n=1 Tax=Desulfobotulus alkaliphilus TaxID=622671 RepID=A0A562RNT6_9BACT|nr:cardiolipin synthase [Desulfobotulus alkaliphilus]TWI70751.1 cardiolipin synthase [Desulfobotulus alkaliphilus]
MLTIIAIVVFLVEVLAIFMAVHAVMYARSSQGAVAWMIALITFPWLTIPLYLIFGRNKFQGYAEALRQGQLEKVAEKPDHKFSLEKFRAFPQDSQKETFRLMENLALTPFTDGNRAKLLINGKNTFGAIFSAISEAEDYILLEFFIVRHDSLGKELQNLLIAKAAQGVRVYFLYDEIGSRKLKSAYGRKLRAAGVRFRPFFTRRGLLNRFQLNFRNHRKIVVVDGKKAFVGGHNVGKKYLGGDPSFGCWRDTHMEIEGPSVMAVQRVFEGDWYWATREQLSLNWKAERVTAPGIPMLVLPTDPAHHLEACSLFFVNLILAAKERVWIASPYFVPNDAVMQALQMAALRGVDVRILLPSRSDFWLVHLASYACIQKLAMEGIRIFRYQPGFLHQKVILVDDYLSGVGTANADNRSFHLNFEITLVAADKGMASQVSRMLEKDFEVSWEVDGRRLPRPEWFFRFAVRFASLFSPVL